MKAEDNSSIIDVSVLIVTYNTAHCIRDTITALLTQTDIRYEVIVVDNASLDSSVEILKSFGDRLKVIANSDNVGYAKANNQAFRASRGQYIYLLNPDAQLKQPRDIRKLHDFMSAHPELGLAGTLLETKDGDSSRCKVHRSYPRMRNILHEFDKLPGDVAYEICASAMIPRHCFELVKGFDEDYFLYGEDMDICLRLRQAGYSIGRCTDVIVRHLSGASVEKLTPFHINEMLFTSINLFYEKHYGKTNTMLILRKEIHKSLMRMFSLRLQMLFSHKLKFRNKYHRYRAALVCSRRSLKRLQNNA